MQRKIDELGRIVFPADIRDALGLRPGQAMSIRLDREQRCITLTPDGAHCHFCFSSENLRHIHGKAICEDCLARAAAQDAPGK